MSDNAAQSFRKFVTTPDPQGDLQFGSKIAAKVVVAREQALAVLASVEELTVEDKALIALLRLPRRFPVIHQCGAVPPERALALLRGLHAAELLDTVEDQSKARAVIPVEVRKALAEFQGQQLVRKKLVANVYRPTLEGEAAPPVVEPPPPPPPPPPPKPAEPVIPPDIKALMEEADKLHPTLSQLDYFSLLGISREATDADIKNAYLAMVRKWHPDRLAGVPKTEGYKPKVEAIFSAVGNANSTLGDKQLREAYLKDLKRREMSGATVPANGRRPARAEEAKLHGQKGRVFMQKKDYGLAEHEYKLAHDCDPDIHEYRVELAWAHAFNPDRPEAARRQEALEQLKEVCKNTKYADAFYKLGMMHRLLGNQDQVEWAMRKALALDKNHVEAAREVRLFEMRAERARHAEETAPSAPAKPEGLLDKLRKKVT